MAYFLVTRERGPEWDGSRAMSAQRGWPAHAAFMNALAAEGFVVLGGPVGDGSRVVLVVDAESEAAIRARLEADPWTPMGLLPVVRIEPWRILLGEPPRRGAA